MKDLRKANIMLGIKIFKLNNGILLDQTHYVEKLLKKYNYDDIKFVNAPFSLNAHLFSTKNENDVCNQMIMLI